MTKINTKLWRVNTKSKSLVVTIPRKIVERHDLKPGNILKIKLLEIVADTIEEEEEEENAEGN
jgi:hypothetical protein